MIVKNVTREQLEKALKGVNALYKNNIRWNRVPEALNLALTSFRLTLRVKDSKLPGHRVSRSGRNLVAACWHVHGNFFEKLFALNSKAIVMTARACYEGSCNWEDFNIGSFSYPLYASDACRCYNKEWEVDDNDGL